MKMLMRIVLSESLFIYLTNNHEIPEEQISDNRYSFNSVEHFEHIDAIITVQKPESDAVEQ